MNGDLFRALCKEHETNATKIAAALGLNRNTIRYWLRGTSTPVLGAAYALAEFLETDVLELWPKPTLKKGSR